MATYFDLEKFNYFLETGKDKPVDNKEDWILETVDNIYKVAKENNICTEPLDVYAVITKLYGLNVQIVDLKKKECCIIGSVTSGEFTIYVNSNSKPERQKFAMAHALGHCIRHKDTKFVFGKLWNDDMLLYKKNAEPSEVEASHFAAELLMPREMFASYIKEGFNTVEKLADKFKVQTLAVKYQACNLKYLDDF